VTLFSSFTTTEHPAHYIDDSNTSRASVDADIPRFRIRLPPKAFLTLLLVDGDVVFPAQ